jgi:flagellar M-ring protein FliF
MKAPQLFAAMPMRAKAGLAGGALVVVIALFLLLRMAGAPSYTVLASGLDPADTGKVTAALDEQAIAYELQANGTTVAVDKAMIGKARVALAEQGVTAGSGGAGPGFELFDKQKLGASDFQQQMTYQRALEGEITRTINSVSGVSGAQVQLVLPEDDLFADTASAATAAVLLEGPGDVLEPGAVRGIAQLVSSSVKGLKSDAVTITDGAGTLLWPTGDGAGAASGATTKQAAEARYATQLESDITAMLTRTLGPGKAQVQVNADLDMDKVTRDELTYARRGVPLKTVTEDERLRGAGATAGGTSGTGGNIPQYAAGAAAGGGNSKYSKRSRSTDFGVDKTVAKVEQAPGQVRKLNVALMLDRSIPAAQATQIRSAVSAAAGLDTTRGDIITAASVGFPKQVVPKTGPVPSALVGPIKWALLGLGALLFAFFTWRHLRRREREALPEPEWLREINEPVRLAELESGFSAATGPLPALPTRHKDESMQRLDQLMDREPARVAAHVRQWMQED